MAGSVGLTCRDMQSSSMTQPPHPSSLSSFITQTHIHAHTCNYSPVNTYKAPSRKRRGGGGRGRDIASPRAHSDGSDVWSRTKKGWRVGQREQGMEMRGGCEEREDAGGSNGWQ